MLADDRNLTYQLDLQANNLCRLCLLWRGRVRIIPGGSEQWGPSEADILKAGVYEFTAQVDPSTDADWTETEDVSSEDEQLESDGELCEQLEAMAFAEEYRETDFEVPPEFFNHTHSGRRGDGSPEKRSRYE